MEEKEIIIFFRKHSYLLLDESFSKHTTLKVGGLIKYFLNPKSIDSLKQILFFIKEHNLKYFILGNGSNLLPSDEYFDGVVINFNKYLNKLEIQDNYVFAESGVMLPVLSYNAMLKGLGGLEWANLIPASLGGAIKMNAGSYGSSISDIIESVTFLDESFNEVTLPKEKLNFGYRNSYFSTKNCIILSVIIRLTPKLSVAIEEEMLRLRLEKQASQPLDYPSAGSIFKNPEKRKAYQLIEDAKVENAIIGGAKVSPKHHNFIINYDNATANDVKNLIELIKKEVYNITATSLQEEVCYFNWR